MSEAGARGVAAVVSGGRGFARKVVLFSSRLFFFRDRQREAAAAFSFLLPRQELFGSASSLPNTSCTRHGQDGGLESSAVSHWCSTPQSPHTVRCQQLVRGHCLLLGAFFFFFGVRINKWKLLFFPPLPSGCAALLWVSCGLLYSALHFLLLRWGVQCVGGVVSDLTVESHLSCLLVWQI